MKKIITIVVALVLAAGAVYYFTEDKKVVDNQENNVVTMQVAPETVPCVGVGPQDCLVVNGENFYSNIEGFNFEPGYEYELKVEKIEQENPPADASKYSYTLVEVVSKTEVETTDEQSSLAPVYVYTWQWQENRFNGGSVTEVPEPSDFELHFEADNRFTSTTDCNTITGTYSIENGTEISMGQIASTKMACPEGSLEQEYVNTLALVESLAIVLPEAGTDARPSLTLTQENGEMIFVGVEK